LAEWIYFIHPPRDNFAATLTKEDERVWAVYFGASSGFSQTASSSSSVQRVDP
jgi:hypothetical protein